MVQTPTPFSIVGTRRTYVPIAHRKCYFVQWVSYICTSIVFGRGGGVSNVFEGFNDWGGRGYDDFVPGEVTKTAPSGDRVVWSPTWSASLTQIHRI